jgi:hypothetical protein
MTSKISANVRATEDLAPSAMPPSLQYACMTFSAAVFPA